MGGQKGRGAVSPGGEHRSYSTVFVVLQLFEGMKAFRGVDNQIRLFRPMLNMERMHRSADRSCLPVSPRPQDRCDGARGNIQSTASTLCSGRVSEINLIT